MTSPRAKAISVAALAVLLGIAGVLVRLPARDGRSLWVDELWRVNLTLEPNLLGRYVSNPDVYTAITSPIYVLAVRLIALFGTAPDTLRLLSFVPSVAASIAAFLLVIRARGGIALAVFVGIVFALNVNFIQYANEFKPYMFEVFVHVACVCAWYELIRTEHPSLCKWLLCFGVFAIGVLSAANVVFILPAACATLLIKVAREPWPRRIAVAISMLGLIVLVGMLYVFVWSYGADKELLVYWADGFYRVGGDGYPAFLFSRARDMWWSAFNVFGYGYLLPGLVLRLMLGVLGYFLIETIWKYVSKRKIVWELRAHVVLYAVILSATVICLNLLNKWPLGAFRPNLFLYAHLVLVVALLAAALPSWKGVNVLFAIPLFYIAQSYPGWQVEQLRQYGAVPEENTRVWESFAKGSEAARAIESDCKSGPSVVFYNDAMAHALAYFRMRVAKGEVGPSLLIGSCVTLRPLTDAGRAPGELARFLASHTHAQRPFWVIYSHIDGGEVDALTGAVKEVGDIVVTKQFNVAGYLEAVRR